MITVINEVEHILNTHGFTYIAYYSLNNIDLRYKDIYFKFTKDGENYGIQLTIKTIDLEGCYSDMIITHMFNEEFKKFLKSGYNMMEGKSYRLYCSIHGLAEGSFKSLESWYKHICRIKN